MNVEDPMGRLQAQITDMGNIIRALQQEAEKNHRERHEARRIPDMGESTSSVPRLQPVKPDTFSGALDGISVDAWIFQMRMFFEYHRVTDEETVRYSAALLTDDAAAWWREHVEEVDAEDATLMRTW